VSLDRVRIGVRSGVREPRSERLPDLPGLASWVDRDHRRAPERVGAIASTDELRLAVAGAPELDSAPPRAPPSPALAFA
jgi:hypothetical protein